MFSNDGRKVNPKSILSFFNEHGYDVTCRKGMVSAEKYMEEPWNSHGSKFHIRIKTYKAVNGEDMIKVNIRSDGVVEDRFWLSKNGLDMTRFFTIDEFERAHEEAMEILSHCVHYGEEWEFRTRNGCQCGDLSEVEKAAFLQDQLLGEQWL